MTTWIALLLLFPLAASVCNILIGRKLPRRLAEGIACTSIAASFACAAGAFASYRGPVTVTLLEWLSVFDLAAPFSFFVDPLSLVLCLMITFVCALIHLYSLGYMAEDPGYVRYFALLNLFVFAMLVLVLAENLPLLYLGWEGVGFCSYALIGFWYREEKNADAGRKAFIVTRVGDVALLVGILWCFQLFGTLSIPEIVSMGFLMPVGVITALGLLFLGGAMGKSAQLPLTVWLPDAMAGPTPVSAQIHAATMVTAGVYLLARMQPLFAASAAVMAAIAATGALTAFYGAICAFAQRDLKRALAYSTISQIGFMMLGVGAGSATAGTFHLLVHAFFKALLFLAAGCVITALHHRQDLLEMGGLKKNLPFTYYPFLAGVLCLSGFPLTGGFFSKDAVVAAALFGGGTGRLLALVAMVTAYLTAVYSFRMLYLVFLGEGPHPSSLPRVMEYTLAPLALLGICGGLLDLPAYLGGGWLSRFLGAPPGHHGAAAELAVQGVAAALALAGWWTAHLLYGGERREARIARETSPSRLQLFLQEGWYLDALYRRLFVTPFRWLAGFLWERVDEGLIDDSLDRMAEGTGRLGSLLGKWSAGQVTVYLTAFAGGAALLAAYFAWMNG